MTDTVKLIIEIPKDHYEALSKTEEIISSQRSGKTFMNVIYSAVANGTPLPKGHGRLIDVNDLLDDINLEDSDYNRDVNTGEIITLENIDRIPTIIEADTESEEK